MSTTTTTDSKTAALCRELDSMQRKADEVAAWLAGDEAYHAQTLADYLTEAAMQARTLLKEVAQ